MARGYLDRIVPASAAEEAALRRGLAEDARRRLRRVVRAWPDRGVRRRLRAVDGEMLASGELRGWLAQVEDALKIARVARLAKRAAVRGARWTRLTDLVTDQGRLADLAPHGSLPDDFPDRAAALARDLLARQAGEWIGSGTFIVSFREEVDLGRPADELDLPGGAVRLRRDTGGPRKVKVIMRRGTARVAGMDVPVTRHLETPQVGATLLSGARRITVGPRDPGFESRVGRAMDLLRDVWPEGARLVTDRTWRVVPLHEPGTVSFSSIKRPGVVYINLRSAPVARLAEDLLHESAHLRLHEIETLHPLIAPEAAGDEGPRFYSPWRREWRPLRGLLHACCTFTVGAWYFDRLSEASEPRGTRHLPEARRVWVARRFLEEIEMVRASLPVLRRGAREGALTPEGARFARAIETAFRALRPRVAAHRRRLEESAAGREALSRYRLWAERSKRRPVRWRWPVAGRSRR